MWKATSKTQKLVLIYTEIEINIYLNSYLYSQVYKCLAVNHVELILQRKIKVKYSEN